MRFLIAAVATTCLAASATHAADLDLGPLRGTGYNSYGSSNLFDRSPESLLRTETASAEIFVGYLNGAAKETVYDTASRGNPKLSQLTWDLGHSLAIGGRLAVRPFDWLSFRAGGWTTVASDTEMRDYDWLYGYFGFGSFSHYSSSPDTKLTRAWQGDASLAATYYQDEAIGLTAIAGFRHLDMKWRANGGHFAYWIGSPGGPVSGTIPDQLAVAYQQSWDVPYLGLGASYTLDNWTLTTEAIASPYVMSRDQDLHALRNLLIKGRMSPSTMFGLSAALEYRITENLALSGQIEYQKFYEAKGDGLYTDLTSGSSFLYPKPGVGMAVDTLLLNLGLKGRI